MSKCEGCRLRASHCRECAQDMEEDCDKWKREEARRRDDCSRVTEAYMALKASIPHDGKKPCERETVEKYEIKDFPYPREWELEDGELKLERDKAIQRAENLTDDLREAEYSRDGWVERAEKAEDALRKSEEDKHNYAAEMAYWYDCAYQADVAQARIEKAAEAEVAEHEREARERVEMSDGAVYAPCECELCKLFRAKGETSEQQECPDCEGKGVWYPNCRGAIHLPCKRCGGTGKVDEAVRAKGES